MKMSAKKIGIILGFALLVMALCLNNALAAVVQPPNVKIYTVDKDFDEGTLVGVEHITVHDQLQLSKTTTTLPFIWIPNLDGTVSKLNTVTGEKLGRYRIAPLGLPLGGSPSRTTVDLDGSCWVGNRQAGTVVKIGLLEAGMWIDRNGDGVCQTSHGDDILPWGQDECVLYEVVLIPGFIGTYAPGTYTGPYDPNNNSVTPRGLAVDSQNNIWAGTWSTSKFYHINGATGTIMEEVSCQGRKSYGAVIDQNGVIWSSSASNYLLRFNPATGEQTPIYLNQTVYGVGLDYAGHVLATGWTSNVISKLDINTGAVLWTKAAPGLSNSRGVVCTADNRIWVANSGNNTVTVYDNEGNHLATIPVGLQPSGVSVDAAGKVWVCDISDDNVHRIDPVTYKVDFTQTIPASNGHYTYSDMTGIIARTITTKIGKWTVIRDSGINSAAWGLISWHGLEPAGTSIAVKVRSSNDAVNWSAWENAANNVALTATPNGRYLQIETTLQILSGDVSPILYDLTVVGANNAPQLHYIGNRTATAGQLMQFRIQAFDPNGDPLVYSASNLPTGATFDPLRKLFIWVPTTAGTYSGIHFKVSDGVLTDSEDITITVNN